MPFERISITLPRDVLQAADRRAKQLDRSRSWVIAEALRAYECNPSGTAARVREAEAPVYGTQDVAEARRRHLATDLARSPEERLRRAEELARVARQRRRARGPRHQIIGFDTYEDFYEWKKANRAGG